MAAGAHALKAISSAAPAAVVLGRRRRDGCSIYSSNNFSNDKINTIKEGSNLTALRKSRQGYPNASNGKMDQHPQPLIRPL
jgi:hypothetical protein